MIHCVDMGVSVGFTDSYDGIAIDLYCKISYPSKLILRDGHKSGGTQGEWTEAAFAMSKRMEYRQSRDTI